MKKKKKKEIKESWYLEEDKRRKTFIIFAKAKDLRTRSPNYLSLKIWNQRMQRFVAFGLISREGANEFYIGA